MDEKKSLTAWGIIARTAAIHTITYFLVGAIAFSVFDYSTMIASGPLSSYMKDVSDPVVRASILFQPLRGVLFGVVFFLLRDAFFRRRNGWLVMWTTLVLIGIFSTFGPAPGSIEGFIYIREALALGRWGGMAEILTQSLLLSALTFCWVKHPEKKWMNWLLGILFVLVVLVGLMSAMLGTQPTR